MKKLCGALALLLLFCCACQPQSGPFIGDETEPPAVSIAPERVWSYSSEEEVSVDRFAFSEEDIAAAEAFVAAVLEEEAEAEYTISLEVKDIFVSPEETAWTWQMYFNEHSELYTDWTEEDMLQNMITVVARYEVEYDGTKTFMDSGDTTLCYHLERRDGEWSFWSIGQPRFYP